DASFPEWNMCGNLYLLKYVLLCDFERVAFRAANIWHNPDSFPITLRDGIDRFGNGQQKHERTVDDMTSGWVCTASGLFPYYHRALHLQEIVREFLCRRECLCTRKYADRFVGQWAIGTVDLMRKFFPRPAFERRHSSSIMI